MTMVKENQIKADSVLDCLGLFCPVPIYLTAKKMNELKVGDVLEVISDDEGIIEDMPAWCKNSGQLILKFEEEKEGVFKFYMKKVKE